MEEQKSKSIFYLTSELHDLVTELYEALIDSDNKEAIALITELSKKLRELKNNITTKDEL